MSVSNEVFYDSVADNVFINICKFNSQTEYAILVNAITENYANETSFTLTIETKNLKFKDIAMKYIYLFAKFLLHLKRDKNQFLLETKILIYDERVYDLLYYLFLYLSSPVAKVVVILYRPENNDIQKIKYYFP